MSNDRLRSTLRSSGYSAAALAEQLAVDPKTVQRWVTRGRTPHRATAARAASLLNVPSAWLWPDLEKAESGAGHGEVLGFYSHRAQVPKSLWLEMLVGASRSIDLVTYAALHLVEDHPETVQILKHKAANGVRVRIALGDPETPQIELRGREEGMVDGIVGRVRMANVYYSELGDAPGVELNLHVTTLYNSLYRYDDQMLVNHHVYGTYGYMAPVLHLRKSEAGDLFDMYSRSLELIWGESYSLAGVARGPIAPSA